MSHVRRLRVSDRIFFITVNLRRKLIRLGEREFDLLAEALRESRRELQFHLCGYVIMPDHWHALIGPAHPLTIPRVVRDIEWTAAGSLNRRRGTRGPVWQHQFWDRFGRTAKQFHQRLDYMHWNPVRSGLVERPEESIWSSYNNFAMAPTRIKACRLDIDYVRLAEEYRG